MNPFIEAMSRNQNISITASGCSICKEGNIWKVNKDISILYKENNALVAWDKFVEASNFNKPTIDIGQMNDWERRIVFEINKSNVDEARKLLLDMYKELSWCEAHDTMVDRRQCHALAIKLHEKFEVIYERSRE